MDGTSQVIGQPLDRTDGPLKVTDGARYAAEFRLAGLCHAVMVLSTVPRGRIVNLDTTRAERAPMLGIFVKAPAPTSATARRLPAKPRSRRSA